MAFSRAHRTPSARPVSWFLLKGVILLIGVTTPLALSVSPSLRQKPVSLDASACGGSGLMRFTHSTTRRKAKVNPLAICYAPSDSGIGTSSQSGEPEEQAGPRGPSTAACDRVMRVASVTADGPPNYGDAASSRPFISRDGRFMAFVSFATNLIPGYAGTYQDIFVKDRLTQHIENVHYTSSHEAPNDGAYWISSLSADGRFVFYSSAATNIIPGVSTESQSYLLDRQSQTIEYISVGLDGASANNLCFSQAMTPDARYLTFTSRATNIVAGDTNNQWDVFRRDRQTGQTIRCSVGLGGAQANSSSGADHLIAGQSPRQVAISDDGNLVAFASRAGNLVPGDSNGTRDIFVFNCTLGLTERVSISTAGQQANAPSAAARNFPSEGRGIDMTPDGRFVAFDSQATNLVAPDPDGSEMNIYIRDRLNSTTTRVPVLGTGVDRIVSEPMLSADGRFVSVCTTANNVIAGQHQNTLQDFLWYDRQAGVLRLINANVQGEGGISSNYFFNGSTMSRDGRFVAFPANASNLVTPSPPTGRGLPRGQIYVRDMLPQDCDGNGAVDACDPSWLDLTAFMDALLATSQTAVQVCRYDLNRDGLLDGRDIAAFTMEVMNLF